MENLDNQKCYSFWTSKLNLTWKWWFNVLIKRLGGGGKKLSYESFLKLHIKITPLHFVKFKLITANLTNYKSNKTIRKFKVWYDICINVLSKDLIYNRALVNSSTRELITLFMLHNLEHTKLLIFIWLQWNAKLLANCGFSRLIYFLWYTTYFDEMALVKWMWFIT